MQSLGNSTKVQKNAKNRGPGDENRQQRGMVQNKSNIDDVKIVDKCATSNRNEEQSGEYNLLTDGSGLPSNNVTVNKLVKTNDENINTKNNNNNAGNNDNNNINVSRGAANLANQLAASSESAAYGGDVKPGHPDDSVDVVKPGLVTAIKPGSGLGAGSQAVGYEKGAPNSEKGLDENEKGVTRKGDLEALMVPAGQASPGGLPRTNNCYSSTAISASPQSKHKCLGKQAFKCGSQSNESTGQAQFPKQQQQQNEQQKQAKQEKTVQKRTSRPQNSNQQVLHSLAEQADELVGESNSRDVKYPDYNPKYPVSGRPGYNTGYNNFNNTEFNDYPAQSDCDEVDYNPNIINESISNNVPLIAASSGENLADGSSLYANKQKHISELSSEPKVSQFDCLTSDSAHKVTKNEGASSKTADIPPNKFSQPSTQPEHNNLVKSDSNSSLPPPPAYSSCIIATNPELPELLARVSSPADRPTCFPDPLAGIYPNSPIDFSSLFTQPIMRKLNFIDESDNFEKLADFLVIPEGSNSPSICDKLFHEWGLETPKLIISVSGWACQMPAIPPRQHNRFKQGLLRIVQSTNTWILSSGITQGVDNLIAEVLQDAQYLEWIGQDDPQLHLIGLVNWNYIRNGDEIQFWASDPSSKDEAFNYNVNSGTDEYATLNKLYSHFVFFDSTSHVKDAEMRSALECYLSTSREPIEEVSPDLAAPLTNTSTIPTVLLVMGGELNVIEQVAKSLVNHVAVVICEGLGGASDIICRSLRVVRKARKPLTPNQETNILNLIRALAKKFGTEIDEVNHTELEFIKIILEYSRYVIIYRIDRPNNHIDECILKALIRSVSELGCDALQLAMNLHQCDDVVQNIVEAESDINNRKNIDETCFRALIEGQLPFVKLFLEVGFEMKRYLTPLRLSTLYQHTIENTTPLLKLLMKTVGPKDSYSLDDVYFMVYYYTLGCPSKSLVDLPDSDNKGFEDPYRELCFWSLFSLKPELVNYFWSKAKNPLIIALMLCKLWEEIYNCLTIDEMDLKEEIEPLMEEYGELALKCLEEYQETNPDLNHFILMFRNPTFGYIDLIDVAGFTDNKNFIATSDAQICIENKWKSGMRCSLKGIIYSLFVPFSIPQIYSEKIEINYDGDSNDNGLTLEEEILLLEEQNQKNFKMLKKMREEEKKLREKAIPPAEEFNASVFNGGKSVSTKGEEEIPLMPTVIVKTKKEKEGSTSGSLNFSEEPDVLIGQLDDTTGVSLKQTTYSQFYQAPVTKFFLHISMYFIFLLIYTYFYCYENAPGYLNSWKITIFVYMLSYVIEIIWHFCQGDIGFKVKLVIWCSSEWNLLDVTYLTFGIVAFFFSISEGWPMVFARALYGITSILMWIRLLRFYLASEKLGSMWIMIRRMLWETIIFMTHMGIMILASGISLYCINYRPPSDNDELFWSNGSSIGVGDTSICPSIKSKIEIYNKPHWLFLKPYFMFNGELFLDKLKCGDNGYMAWVMAALVLLLGNALMLNLLVAIYAAIFNDVQENSEREWKMEMYWLLKDFEEKTILPPPLSLIETVVQLVRVIHRKYNNYDHKRGRGSVNQVEVDTVLNAQTTKRMQVFETYCVGKALRKMAGKKTSYDSVVDMIQDTEAQLGKVQDCKTMVNNVRRMIQAQRMRRRARRRVGNAVVRSLPDDH